MFEPAKSFPLAGCWSYEIQYNMQDIVCKYNMQAISSTTVRCKNLLKKNSMNCLRGPRFKWHFEESKIGRGRGRERRTNGRNWLSSWKTFSWHAYILSLLVCFNYTLNHELCSYRSLPSTIHHCASINSSVGKLNVLDLQELDSCFLKHVETIIVLHLKITLQVPWKHHKVTDNIFW